MLLLDAVGQGSQLYLALGKLKKRRTGHVLLVDDNEAFATAMASLLNAMGHNVQAIHDSGAAIATARALRPQVVLLDASGRAAFLFEANDGLTAGDGDFTVDHSALRDGDAAGDDVSVDDGGRAYF